MKRLARFQFLFFILFTCLIHAGVYIETFDKEAQGMGGYISNVSGQATKMYIDNDRVRMDMPAMMGKEMSVIYRVDKQLFWYIDHTEQTYMEMTQDDLKKIKSQIDQMKKMMEEQMKNMPAEQRAMMEKMMSGQMNAMEGENAKYKLVKKNVKIEKWNTDQYAGYTAGEKTDEVWTCELSDIGLVKSDFVAMEKISSFFSALGSDESFFEIHSADDIKKGEFPGVPIKSVQYEDGRVISESLVKKVEKRSFKSGLFDLPTGYTKTEQQFGPQGGNMFKQ